MKSIVVIAPGKMLSREDVEAVKASGLPVAAVGLTVELLPCKYCYHADGRWWHRYFDVVKHHNPQHMVTCEALSVGIYGTEGLEWVEHISGLREFPNKGVTTGSSSGQHILIYLVNEGYENIILLGYEYGAAGDGHYHGDYPHGVQAPSNWRFMVQDMARTAAQIAGKGVRVVNCTEVTALDCFKRGALKDELERCIDRPAKTRRSARHEAVENPASV